MLEVIKTKNKSTLLWYELPHFSAGDLIREEHSGFDYLVVDYGDDNTLLVPLATNYQRPDAFVVDPNEAYVNKRFRHMKAKLIIEE